MTDKPDEFHQHELLHTTRVVMDLVAEELLNHDACNTVERHTLASQAHKALFDLYQLVGRETL